MKTKEAPITRLSLLICILFTVMSAGCATLSKEQCLQGDWSKIGYDDGVKGHVADMRLHEHGKACAEYNITIDTAAYEKGWNEGVATYCTEKNGYQAGRDLDEYRWVCPKDMEPVFLKGYEHGLNVAEDYLRIEIANTSSNLAIEILELTTLKGKAYKKQKNEIERIKNDLRGLERDLDKIDRLRREIIHIK